MNQTGNHKIQSEEFYRRLCEGSGDPIFGIDLRDVIIYAGPAAERLLKFPASQMIGKPFRKFIHRNSRERAISYFQKAKAATSPVTMELDAVDAKGNILPVEATVNPLSTNGSVESFHLSIRDVSRRREFELLIRESEKIQTIQSVVAGTARGIRHPLLATLNRIQSLLKKYGERDFEYISFKDYSHIIKILEAIQQEIQSSYDTLDNIIHSNHLRGGLSKTCCDANQVIREIVLSKEQELRAAGVTAQLRLAADMPRIRMGKIDFHQMVSNIVDNAIKSMPAGGPLTITTAYQKSRQTIQVEVKDQGVGIEQENLRYLLDPVHDVRKGKGHHRTNSLGLPAIAALLKACEGSIDIKSSLRKGTTIKLVFPLFADISPFPGP